jgi:hypothetical protein
MERLWKIHEKYDSLNFLLGLYIRHTDDVLASNYLVLARDSWGVEDARAKYLERSRRQAFRWDLEIGMEWYPSYLYPRMGKTV